MSPRAPSPEQRLSDMVAAARQCAGWSQGVSPQDLADDPKLFDALCRNIIIIGEAASHVPVQYRSQMSAIPWRNVVATRNLLVHEYWLVERGLLLMIVHNELPRLISAIDAWRNAKART
jgi:uncharacterized protein with HEPN domain